MGREDDPGRTSWTPLTHIYGVGRGFHPCRQAGGLHAPRPSSGLRIQSATFVDVRVGCGVLLVYLNPSTSRAATIITKRRNRRVDRVDTRRL